jgi:antitoxin (DNA-binding transcriptional repressor) of toxin-antitoxin stability system
LQLRVLTPTTARSNWARLGSASSRVARTVRRSGVVHEFQLESVRQACRARSACSIGWPIDVDQPRIHYGHVKIANLAEVKNDLSRFVALVRRGDGYILVRGVPAADLVPVQGTADPGEGDALELAELEALGLVRRAATLVTAADKRELERPGPHIKGGQAVEALIATKSRTRWS